MFKIYDGREEFYQWDLNRKLIVEDKSMTQVHFCNRTGSCSLIRDVYEVNGMYLVDVPNILLQDNWDIKVYGYDSSYTKHSAVYDVIARTRPENYVYTDEEQKIWEQIEDQFTELEANCVTTEYVDAAIEANCVTKDYIDAAIEAIELIPGPQGEPGKDGEDYVLTDTDKTDIATLVLEMLPAAEEVEV